MTKLLGMTIKRFNMKYSELFKRASIIKELVTKVKQVIF